jgi:hypothetical protein
MRQRVEGAIMTNEGMGVGPNSEGLEKEEMGVGPG